MPISGTRHLVVGEDLQQEGLELLVGLVHLVDQQHRALRLAQRAQQRARLEEALGEEQVAEAVQLLERGVQAGFLAQRGAEAVLQDLGVEELLAVLPLVQRLALVQALVALHADQRQAEPGGGGLRQLGLADAGRAFDQDRLAQVVGEKDGGRGLPVGDVAGALQPRRGRLDGGEQGVEARRLRRRSHSAAAHGVELAVGPQLGRVGEAVGHGEEGGDGGDVPDLLLVEAGVAEGLAVRLPTPGAPPRRP